MGESPLISCSRIFLVFSKVIFISTLGISQYAFSPSTIKYLAKSISECLFLLNVVMWKETIVQHLPGTFLQRQLTLCLPFTSWSIWWAWNKLLAPGTIKWRPHTDAWVEGAQVSVTVKRPALDHLSRDLQEQSTYSFLSSLSEDWFGFSVEPNPN